MEPLHEWVELPFSNQNVLMENLHIDVVWLERRMVSSLEHFGTVQKKPDKTI
jgi:hypothetical protein